MSLLEALASAADQGNDERLRYFGIVHGVITDVDDDADLGRVKARLKGMPDNSETDWLVPGWPGGIEGIPHKNDQCVVFFEDGNENKGWYLWFPSSKTQKRPNEALVLGLTFAAMYNDLVAKVNQLIVHFFAHGHAETGATTGAPVTATTGTPLSPATIAAAGKMQKADGSTVSAQATVITAGDDQKALSGRVKVGV